MKKTKTKTKTKTEVSAGGLIVTKVKNDWWMLLMKDRGGNWTFPKGKMEKGEDHLATATREIEEEVGISGLTRIATLTPSMYWYFRDGSIKKTVHFFLFESPTKQHVTVQTEEGISEAKWVPFAKVKDMIGYPKTNTPLLDEVAHILGV